MRAARLELATKDVSLSILLITIKALPTELHSHNGGEGGCRPHSPYYYDLTV